MSHIQDIYLIESPDGKMYVPTGGNSILPLDTEFFKDEAEIYAGIYAGTTTSGYRGENHIVVKCAIIAYCGCCQVRYALGYVSGLCETCSHQRCDAYPDDCVYRNTEITETDEP